ncbi:MAG: 4'-phosphopantetheinyl transferase superfamily protein [Candidatus Solibacter sp.]
MSNSIEIWRVRLDRVTSLAPTPNETEHAARLALPILRRRYLRAHAALRDILQRHTDAPLVFSQHEKGKPYLASDPTLHFSLTHSRDLALIAVTRACPVGIDVERLRPMTDIVAIAQRYFPGGTPPPATAREFFRQWTQFEALLKAQGTGLFGITEFPGEWTVSPIDAGPRYAAAVACEGPPRPIRLVLWR